MDNFGFPCAGALALAAAIFCVPGSCPAVVAQQPERSLARPELRMPELRVDESRMVALAGNTPAIVRAGTDLGPLDGETRLERMQLLLKPSAAQQAALDALVEAQQEPGSAVFHHWLTPVEFGARYGAGAADVARVTAWLESHGFEVNEVAAGRRIITFSGTAGQVEEAFGTSIHRFRTVTNSETGAAAEVHLANVNDPEIPEALAGAVAGVVSLHDVRRRPALHVLKRLDARGTASRGAWNLNGSHYLYPADLAAIYDVAPVYAAGTEGKGVGIAIAGRSNLTLSDVAAFRAAAGLAANAPTVVLPGVDPGLVVNDQDEATLDVEWAGAMAPAAKVTLVTEASTATTDGIDLAASYIVNHAVAPVVSVSYAACEKAMGTTERAFYDSLWEQAAAEGMSVFVASGDAGAAGCDAGADAEGTQAGVSGMCSSVYATCVGGTELNDSADSTEYWSGTNGTATNGEKNGSALGYIPEQVWNESASDGGAGLWATGGGVSTVYAQPKWQAGVKGTASANGMRAVPDVALTAASHDGYVMVEDGMSWIVSGTSAATPSFAALMALVEEKQGGKLGNVNSDLYALAGLAPDAWHATGTGNNDVPGVTGFAAIGEAYNLATGLGSVDAKALVAKWALTQAPTPVGIRPGSWMGMGAGAGTGPIQSRRRLIFSNAR